MEKINSKLFLFAAIGLTALSYSVDAFADADVSIEFLDDSYSFDDTAVIRITDPAINLYSQADSIDSIDIAISSDADTVGTTITLYETDISSDIFEGTVFFVLDDYTSGHRLQVVQGGQIYATYGESTASATVEGTPSQITDTAELEEKPSSSPETIGNEHFVPESSFRPDAFLEWLNDDVLLSTDTAIISVNDPYMDKDVDEFDTLEAYVYTNDDEDEGIIVELTETDRSSGIFQSNLFFRTTGESQAYRLLVAHNDIVSAEYGYSTVPGSNMVDISVGDEIRVVVPNTTLSLKSQIFDGLDLKQISCPNPDHVLVQRANDKIACVESATAEKFDWQLIAPL